MKRIGNFWDKVCSMDNLIEAHKNARKDKLFYQEVKMVDSNPEKYLKKIQDMLINKTYIVSPYIHKTITDRGKVREVYKLPYFPDRIIQWALMLQITDMFESYFVSWSCASRPNKGITYASNILKTYLRQDPQGTKYCLKLDIHKFYPSIDRKICKSLVRKKIKDKEALWLIDLIIDSHTESGLPIGSYLSQYLANFYLTEFDHWLKEQKHVKYIVRYMDDIVILSDNKKYLHKLKKDIEDYLNNKLNLHLNNKWQIFPVDARGIDFLGFLHYHNHKYKLRKKTCKRYKKLCLSIQKKIRKGQPLTYSDWCACNSYRGWLKWCNSNGLYFKYLYPLEPYLKEYYLIEIKGKGGKE